MCEIKEIWPWDPKASSSHLQSLQSPARRDLKRSVWHRRNTVALWFVGVFKQAAENGKLHINSDATITGRDDDAFNAHVEL